MARKFRGTPTTTLQTIHDGLVTFFSTGGAVASGVQSYSIAGRSVQRMSVAEMATLLDEVSNELKIRALPDADEVGLADFA